MRGAGRRAIVVEFRTALLTTAAALDVHSVDLGLDPVGACPPRRRDGATGCAGSGGAVSVESGGIGSGRGGAVLSAARSCDGYYYATSKRGAHNK